MLAFLCVGLEPSGLGQTWCQVSLQTPLGFLRRFSPPVTTAFPPLRPWLPLFPLAAGVGLMAPVPRAGLGTVAPSFASGHRQGPTQCLHAAGRPRGKLLSAAALQPLTGTAFPSRSRPLPAAA